MSNVTFGSQAADKRLQLGSDTRSTFGRAGSRVLYDSLAPRRHISTYAASPDHQWPYVATQHACFGRLVFALCTSCDAEGNENVDTLQFRLQFSHLHKAVKFFDHLPPFTVGLDRLQWQLR